MNIYIYTYTYTYRITYCILPVDCLCPMVAYRLPIDISPPAPCELGRGASEGPAHGEYIQKTTNLENIKTKTTYTYIERHTEMVRFCTNRSERMQPP